MGKTILLVHGRSMKPLPEALEALWMQAIRAGLERDHGADAVTAFDNATVEMVYYGNYSNEFLHDKNPGKYPDPDNPEFETGQVEGRTKALEALRARPRAEFYDRTVYKNLPQSSGLKEFVADLFAGSLSLLRVSNLIIERVAPDMAEYWSDETRFGSQVRERMISPLKRAFDSGDSICIIAHSLGTLVAYDTLWKFSRYGEYRGALTNGVNYNDHESCQVDLFITLGSPLGDSTVINTLKGSSNGGHLRYPANIKRWVNIAAEDDYISHDGSLADDFRGIFEHGLIDQPIEDERIYNLSIVPTRPDGDEEQWRSNPHHISGYLMHPAVSDLIAAWL